VRALLRLWFACDGLFEGMTLRSVRAQSICPPVVTGFQVTPAQSSEMIRLRTIRGPHALSSVAN
jgi:hypothetical protein